MLFLTLTGADIDFLNQELRWKTYTIKEALKLVGKKEFAAIVLDPKRSTCRVTLYYIYQLLPAQYSSYP